MKIFISWSGKRSRAVAEALNEYLKRVIQAVKPFYSPDIEKGAKWGNEIDNALEGTKFGIICLTPDNLHSTWVHYEAGALSKTPDAKIWTFLHGLGYGDVPPPLGKFQHTVAEKDDVLKLLQSINARLADVGLEPLGEQFLEENFNLFWGLLEKQLKEAEKLSDNPQVTNNEEPTVQRGEREMLGEVLELMREQQRRLERIQESTELVIAEHPLPVGVRKDMGYSFYRNSGQLSITYKNKIDDKIKRSIRSYLTNLLGYCEVEFLSWDDYHKIIITSLPRWNYGELLYTRLIDDLTDYGLQEVEIEGS